jgi:beta-lactamase regulating signal transducer with metallopeptidase domain
MPWAVFAGVIVVQSIALYLLAKAVASRIRAAQWKRAIWQAALVAMLGVGALEISGGRSWFVPAEPSDTVPPAGSPQVVVTIKEPDLKERGPVELPPSAKPTAAARVPIWVWIGVSLLLLARVGVGQLLALSLRCQAGAVIDSATIAKIEALRAPLGVRRAVRLLESQQTGSPFTFGVVAPAIVLPRDFTQRFSPAQQSAALAHELAHVAGFDSAWRAVANAATALFWWNPFLWLIARELAQASELAADESSLLIAEGPSALAECLVLCARAQRRLSMHGVLGMVGFRSGLGRRVERLTRLTHQDIARPVRWPVRVLGSGLLLVICTLLGAKLLPESTFSVSELHAAFVPMASAQPVQDTEPIVTATNDGPALITRFYRVETNNLARWIERQDPDLLLPRDLLVSAGVKLDQPGRAVFYNDRLGVLMVRATREELEAVEEAVNRLQLTRTDIELHIRFFQLSSNIPPVELPATTKSIEGGDGALAIMADAEFRRVLRELENMGGTDLLSAPKVTTLSGRHAQVKVVDVRYLVTDLEGDEQARPISQPFEIGPVVDVIPVVQPDGKSVHLRVHGKVLEFLGYASPKEAYRILGATADPNAETPFPLPKMRTREVSATAVVGDGQTLVLGTRESRVEVGHPVRAANTNVGPQVLFFITPRLIRPTGEPVHSPLPN